MHLRKRTHQIFETLVDGLGVGGVRKLDKGSPAFLPVTVERLTEQCYSITHYRQENGDLIPDPDVEFWRCPKTGAVYPVAIQHSTGHYVRTLIIENEAIESWRPRAHKDLVSFVGLLLRNIKAQQGLAA